MYVMYLPSKIGLDLPDISEYLTVAEFAKIADKTRYAVNKMIKGKRVRAILKGKTYLIHKSELSKTSPRK